MIADSPFARLPHAEREAIIAFAAQKFGKRDDEHWQIIAELETWNHVAIAYLKRDMYDAAGCGGHRGEYDPGAEMFAQR